MITVYGADWCEDTRRSQRLLRRLHVPHRYVNIDDDLDGLERAKALNHGERRTPTIDLGLGGEALVEPDNDTLAAALVEREMLTLEEAHERLGIQNVGDIERVARTTLGARAASPAPPPRRGRCAGRCAWPASSRPPPASAGWCPAYLGRRRHLARRSRRSSGRSGARRLAGRQGALPAAAPGEGTDA